MLKLVLALSLAATAIAPSAGLPSGGERILYAFAQQGAGDGAGPLSGVVARAAGALYGTTTFGGAYSAGTVFKLAPSQGGGYKEHVLYSFGRRGDGATPAGGLAIGASGDLYAVTIVGGAANAGTVVKLTPSGAGYRERVIYSFANGSDGGQPLGTPVIDRAGNVYGVTQFGGSNSGECHAVGGCGVVFKLSPSRGAYGESAIYAFPGGAGGILPQAGLTRDASGALYGTTYGGGDFSSCPSGCGLVFKLAPSSKGYSESVLHVFHGGADGSTPYSALTVDEQSGKVYGTTEYGGSGCNGTCGTVYELKAAGSGYDERVIYAFTGGVGGGFPQAPVLLASGGAIYGTANLGGKGCSGIGCGLVFKLTPHGPAYAYSVVHYFESGKDGAEPQWTRLISDAIGALYGTTRSGGGPNCSDGGPGGTPGCGVVFRIVP
jgi:uncharacterized repeat protein (TIGR03803 family)